MGSPEKIGIARKKKIVSWFRQNAKGEETELVYGNPFELIVAVILSAQCTDKRVNMVTPALLKAYPTAEKMSKATREEILRHIKSISYPNSKADHLLRMSQMLLSDFGGNVPSGIDDLMKLPGVGRKTANVVSSVCFNEPVIAVDTHVFRVAHRLGLSSGNTPYEVEQDLEKLIPLEDRAKSHHWLILHGRYVCKAQKPDCGNCPVNDLCPKLLDGSKLSQRRTRGK